MPKVDGLGVLRRINQDRLLHGIPVIMLTTADEPREVDRCYELGCNF
jgi:CheY-like chemotaxis protein